MECSVRLRMCTQVHTMSTATPISLTLSWSRQHHTSPGSELSFQTLVDLLHSSPGHSGEPLCLIKWWHTDFQELRQPGGISTVMLFTLYEHKDNLLHCFQMIRDSGDFDPVTVREAGGFVRMLEEKDFCLLLVLFQMILPHVDMLFNQQQ